MHSPTVHDDAAERPFTMLGVWAHPDDEAYLSATLMHRVTAAGGRVIVATATRGEAGSAEADATHVAAVRETELRAALAIVGVSDVRFLGLADGHCDREDPDLMTSTIGMSMGPPLQSVDHRELARRSLRLGSNGESRLRCSTLTRRRHLR